MPEGVPRYIPICWRLVATQRTTPQRTPPVRSVLCAFLLSGFFVNPNLSVTEIIIIKKSEPIMERIQLKEYGPIASPP